MQPDTTKVSVEQPVIWIVQFNDGSQKMEFDRNGKETIFTDDSVLKRRDDFNYIGLKDLINEITYSIDLHTGHFILHGQKFSIAKELDGRIHTLPEDLDFAANSIQFKCSKPVELNFGKPLPTTSYPQTYNIGFKVSLPADFCSYRKGDCNISITHCQAMLSVDADSLQPAISSTWTGKMQAPNGKTYELKL